MDLGACEERLSSMALVSSNSAADLRFAPGPTIIPRLASISCKEGGEKGCTLVDLALGVKVLPAAPLLAELAGDEGPDAMRYCTGCIGIGGLLAAVCTATASCGRE